MGLIETDVGLQNAEQQQDNHHRELKKHAATIHCSNTLSLLQRKISNALLYHAYGELMLKEEHTITMKQLCALIGYQGHNHAVIREALKGLISTIIEWNLFDQQTGTENWTASSIIASVSLQGPLCYYAYSPRMKQLLHSPSMFGKIDLVIQSKFRSSYGLALYENCIRYRGLAQTKWFEIALFKKIMGVSEGLYDVFRDFKKRVLDKAVDEVNAYSDLIITPEYAREGRKIVKVRFILKERAKKIRLGETKSQYVPRQERGEGGDALTSHLQSAYGLSAEKVKDIFSIYERNFIEKKLHFIESSKQFQEGQVKNKAGYLLSALKKDYQTPVVQKEDVHATRIAQEITELKQAVERIKVEYMHYREKIIHEVIDTLPFDRLKKFKEDFVQYAAATIQTVLQLQRGKYTPDTVLESPQIRAQMRQFALQELTFIQIPTLAFFVAEQEESKRQVWQKLKAYDPDHPLLKCAD
ncbi:MAG TPA: replication initiation protein [Gammaproteobacteria bacterium]|jgi:hypothetical protein|nr:replication initiation protein [Gammaproteobacteria bacterium]